MKLEMLIYDLKRSNWPSLQNITKVRDWTTEKKIKPNNTGKFQNKLGRGTKARNLRKLPLFFECHRKTQRGSSVKKGTLKHAFS